MEIENNLEQYELYYLSQLLRGEKRNIVMCETKLHTSPTLASSDCMKAKAFLSLARNSSVVHKGSIVFKYFSSVASTVGKGSAGKRDCLEKVDMARVGLRVIDLESALIILWLNPSTKKNRV